MSFAIPSRRMLLQSGLNPDAAKVFAAFTTPPTPQRKAVANRLVKALKLAEVWPTRDVFHVPAAADSQAATINWINPGTFTATLTNVTFTPDRGVTGNGTSSVFDTTFIPSTNGKNFSLSGASVHGRVQTTGGNPATNNTILVGDTDSFVVIAWGPGGTGTNVLNLGFGNTSNATLHPSFYIYSSDTVTGSTYQDGSLIDAHVESGTPTLSANSIKTLARTTTFANGTTASLGAGGPLTAAQAAALAAADLAYMQAVGAA